MAARTAQPNLEELLSHADWLRGLARRLVTDAAAADDLVQETWLAAMRNPPDPERPAKPWLAGVLRNLVRLRARTEGRRTWRQTAVAKKDELPSTAELLERVDTGRKLTELVLELAEPYRTTVLLRYQHDLSAAEIARRQGVPAGTVRWRLKRGLDELRGHLDARYPDRASWCLALVALERTGTSGSGVGLASGQAGPSVAAAFKVGAGVAVFGALLWLPLRGMMGTKDDAQALVIAASRDDSRRVEPMVQPEGLATIRRAVPDSLGTLPDDAPRETRVRVTRKGGTPVAGLPTVLLDAAGEDHSATTDAGGVATYTARPGAATLYSMRPGAFLERHDVELGEADSLVTIEAGSVLAGRVTLDGRVPGEPLEMHLLLDQQLFAGATLPDVVMDAFSYGRKAVLQTDEAGRFHFEGLDANWSGLLYLPVGYALVGRPAPGVSGGGPTLHFDRPRAGVVVELRTLPVLTGRVVEADGHTPVAGATVRGEVRGARGERWRVGKRADEAGRFRVVLDGDEFASVDLTWSGPDGRGREAATLSGPLGVRDLALGDLALAQFPVTAFQVLDDAGLALAGALGQTPDGTTRSTPTGADGRSSIAFDGEVFQVRARGFRSKVVEAQPTAETIVRLERGNLLTLLVRTSSEANAPIARAEVQLSSTGPLFMDSEALRDVDRDIVRADAQGRVELSNLRPSVPITLEVRDILGDVIHEEQLPALTGTEARVHEVRVDQPLRTLMGRAVDPAGKPIVGMVLFIESPGGERRFKTRTMVPGTFSIPFLGTETVDIVLEKSGFAKTALRAHPLEPAEQVEISVPYGRDVHVRVANELGVPVPGGVVVARSPASELEWRAKPSGETGHHVLIGLEAAELEVSLVLGGWTYTAQHNSLDPELAFEIPRQGAVRVRYALEDDAVLADHRIVLEPRDARGEPLEFQPPERSGIHTFETVRSGLYDLSLVRDRPGGASLPIGTPVPVTAAAGSLARVELALE